MAKSRTIRVASATPTIRIQAPRSPSRYRRAGHHIRRAAGTAGRKALEEKHTLMAVVGGAALGLIEKEGIALPSIPKLGISGTYGVVAWAAGKYLKSRTLSHVATGLLAIAAYELAKTGKISDGTGKVSGNVFPVG